MSFIRRSDTITHVTALGQDECNVKWENKRRSEILVFFLKERHEYKAQSNLCVIANPQQERKNGKNIGTLSEQFHERKRIFITPLDTIYIHFKWSLANRPTRHTHTHTLTSPCLSKVIADLPYY